jgi:hypothetical protein
MRCAEIALYEAKKEGVAAVRVYEEPGLVARWHAIKIASKAGWSRTIHRLRILMFFFPGVYRKLSDGLLDFCQ